MLERLLALMRQGGLQTTESLARRLGVTPGLVDLMLADLERLGYVAQVAHCGDQCSGCDVQRGCEQQTLQKLWMMRRR